MSNLKVEDLVRGGLYNWKHEGSASRVRKYSKQLGLLY